MRHWLTIVAMLVLAANTAAQAAPVDAEHAALARLAGQWTVKQTMWATPGAAPAIDQGDADLAMVLDGSRLRQNLRIAARDKPFEGLGYIGYDTATHRFFSTWMDVNFTGIILATGSHDAATHSYVFTGAVPDSAHPGATIPLREVMRVIDADHFTYDYFETRNGKEAQAIRLEYTRGP